MSTLLGSKAGQISRKFSNGQLLLKLPQTEEAVVGSRKTSDGWMLRSAIFLSFLGFGFSAFSTQRLCDSSKPQSQFALMRKSCDNSKPGSQFALMRKSWEIEKSKNS